MLHTTDISYTWNATVLSFICAVSYHQLLNANTYAWRKWCKMIHSIKCEYKHHYIYLQIWLSICILSLSLNSDLCFQHYKGRKKRRQTWWLGSTECVRSRWLYISLQVCFIMNEWKIMRHWGHIGCYISLSHEIVAYSNADDCVDHRVYSNWRTRHINT